MRTPYEKVKQILALKRKGLSSRQIALQVLGSASKKSTVNDILAREQGAEFVEHIDDPIKMLFIDIETSKILAYVWGLFKQNVGIKNVVEDWYVICYSAKWLGQDEVINHSVHHDPLPTSGRYKHNEYKVVKSAWKLLDEAKYVVAYNGKKFDKKKLNAKFLEYGLPEPSPYKIIDPYLIVKGNFALTSNKLDWVERILNHEGKHKTDEQLWLDCMNDDLEALEYMQKYCDNDVIALERDYLKLRHWDKQCPNIALEYEDDKVRCNCCGSSDLSVVDDVYAKTQVSKFSVLKCNNCGKHQRDRTSVLDKDKRSSLTMNIGG